MELDREQMRKLIGAICSITLVRAGELERTSKMSDKLSVTRKEKRGIREELLVDLT